jgi:two-component system NtrC family response regulator
VTHSTPERSPEQTLREILASAEANVPPWSAARPVRVGAGMVAVGLAMRSLVEKLPRIARSGSSVLLHGESGTGKEVIANEIHRLSACSAGPFVAVNCAAIPAALFESELFGHRRGAFTGAERDRAGLIAQADGGTLFLDEIGELPQQMQAKLLRVLQDAHYRRVGDSEPRSARFRLIAATNRELRSFDREGALRSDLYYRIAVIELRLPPLRERREDIGALCLEFARSLAPNAPPHFSDRCLAALHAYDWPGNVRELRNAIEHAFVLADGGSLEPEHLPLALQVSAAAPGSGAPAGGTLQQVEVASIVHALERTGGNQTQAAALLGITRRALGYRIQKHELRARPGDLPPRIATVRVPAARAARTDAADERA